MAEVALQAPLRVLVVDDCPDAAETVATLIRLWGHEAAVAGSGPAALEAALACPPHVVLLDIGLPGLGGCEVARRLRAVPGLDKVRLVAMTGHGGVEDRRRIQEAGFDVHLV